MAKLLVGMCCDSSLIIPTTLTTQNSQRMLPENINTLPIYDLHVPEHGK